MESGRRRRKFHPRLPASLETRWRWRLGRTWVGQADNNFSTRRKMALQSNNIKLKNWILSIIQNLRCGTRYQIYLTGYNVVGTSGPSNAIIARTKGETPLVPSLASALNANSTHITVFLNGWQERGCSILAFGVDFKMDGETYWTSGNNWLNNTVIQSINSI